MQRFGAFLLLLAACLVLSAPAMGCAIANEGYRVNISASIPCPLPGEGYNIDGWQEITYANYSQTQVKLLKAFPNDDISSLDLAEGAKSFMEREGGVILNVENVTISGLPGVKVKASFTSFTGGKGVIVDVILDEGNLFEALSRDEKELEEILKSLRIEK